MSFYCWAFSFFFSSLLGKSEIVPFFAAAVQRGQKGSLKKYVCATCMAEKKKSQSMVVEHSVSSALFLSVSGRKSQLSKYYPLFVMT